LKDADLKKDFDLGKVTVKNFIHLTQKEKETVRRWRNCRYVRDWMHAEHIISETEHLKFIENLKKDGKNFYWLVKHKTGRYLGVIYLQRVDFQYGNAYLGIYKNPFSKQFGIGTLLMDCLMKIAFNRLKLHTLKLEVIKDNRKAIHLYRKIGFKNEGRLKEMIFRDNKWLDVLIMGLIYKKKKVMNEA
jgi:UDP-4-amino-4,6-dideoxy-N-acetyl-beta-L-altrosamine N-acetyltransferase